MAPVEGNDELLHDSEVVILAEHLFELVKALDHGTEAGRPKDFEPLQLIVEMLYRDAPLVKGFGTRIIEGGFHALAAAAIRFRQSWLDCLPPCGRESHD